MSYDDDRFSDEGNFVACTSVGLDYPESNIMVEVPIAWYATRSNTKIVTSNYKKI